MIFDTTTLSRQLHLKADLCVIGSGPGGAMVAREAAAAGQRVVVLEAGDLITPDQMTQREEQMIPQLYWEGGARATRDRAVRIHQGLGVGGSTLHNLNLCKRIPQPVLSGWSKAHRHEHLPLATWSALYDEVEQLLEVKPVPRARWNLHNQILERGCKALGWRGGGLRHNRTGCIGSGFCEIGCAYDAKNNALKVAIPAAVDKGAQVLTRCQATRIRHQDGRVSGVDAVTLVGPGRRPEGTIRVEAPRVCVAASATGTPALLERSAIPDPSGQRGRRLRIHPAVVVAAEFEERIEAWRGIPQTYECTEHLSFDDGTDKRVWIVPAFAHPMATATLMPGHGDAHRAMMKQYPRLGVLTAMVHDESHGRVEPDGNTRLAIDYWPARPDRQQLSLGAYACAKLLFAAGAKCVVVPNRPPLVFQRGQSIESLRSMSIERGQVDITAVHPMASIGMDDDPARAAVGSDGRHHGVDGLYVADGSLFPTSIGVPPQLSIYAIGLHVGRTIAAATSR